MLPENFKCVELHPYVRHNGQHVRIFTIEEWCEDAQAFYPVLTPGKWRFQFASKNEKPVDDSKIVYPEEIIRDVVNRPKSIIVFREKHSDRYFSANTTEEVGKVAVKIVMERQESGYYEPLPPEPVMPKHSEDAFPDDPDLADTVRKQWKRYEIDLVHFEDARHEQKLLKKATEDKNYLAAFQLLQVRNSAEYESFTIETLEEA